MDKVILISIPETSIKLMIEEAVSKAISDHLPKNQTNSKIIFEMQEACDYVGISISHGYKLTSQKLIPFSKRGRKNYFDKDQLDQWLMENVSKDAKSIKQKTNKYILKNPK